MSKENLTIINHDLAPYVLYLGVQGHPVEVTNNRHTKSCITTVREVFPGGIHKNPATIFEKLKEIGIVVPHCDRHFPFFACYDFKVYFSKKQISNSSMLTLDACKIPLSVAIASNVPGYESGVCFVTEGSEEELIQKLVDYLESLFF